MALAGAAVLAATCVLVQWNADGNRRVDLRIYYRSIESMSSGHLYDYGHRGLNFLYPPFAALVLRPLGLVGEDAASRIWLVVSVALGLAAFVAALSRLEGERRATASGLVVIAAACLFTDPAFLTFRLGQVNALVAFLVAIDVVAMSRRSRYGGIGVGLAAAIKVSPLLLVAALLVSASRRRDGWRALATFFVSGAVTAVVLPHETWRFWTQVLFEASKIGGVGAVLNASIYSVTGTITADHLAQRALWIVGSALVLALAARGLRDRFEHDLLGAVVVVMCVSYVVSPLTWFHHQWFAVVALVVWVVRARRPFDWAVVALGVFVIIDPLGVGEVMWRTTLMVAFGVVSAVALPRRQPTSSDFPAADAIAEDVPDYREERSSHVRPDPVAPR